MPSPRELQRRAAWRERCLRKHADLVKKAAGLAAEYATAPYSTHRRHMLVKALVDIHAVEKQMPDVEGT